MSWQKRMILPPLFEIHIKEADLQDVTALNRAFQNLDALYLNLATDSPTAAFQPETQGVANILKAIEGTSIQHIYKLSGLGAYCSDLAKGKPLFENEIRKQGHQLIQANGIPHTFFHATWFMESLPAIFQKGNTLQGFKTLPHPFYWIAGEDYARMVGKALTLDNRQNYNFIIQGKEPIKLSDALRRYAIAFSPALKVKEAPISFLRFLSFFVSKLRTVVAFANYFQTFEEELRAQSTWEQLGEPIINLETFAARIKTS
jgi:uncharacterized protein YbjT (DUF2867 family)